MRLLEFFEQGLDKGLRLYQFIRYAVGVYNVGQTFKKIQDTRRSPDIPTQDVVLALFLAAVLRIPSLNELESQLGDGRFQKLLGHRGAKVRGKALFSADTIADVLDTIEVATLQAALVQLIKKAERNKAFRDDTFGTFVTVAIDGWEPFCTYKRHCEGCLTRKVTVKKKDENGNEIKEKVTQYYHRFVVAFLVAPKLDMTLAIEPVLSSDLREDLPLKEARHEGELTAALRLIDRLHRDYGCFIDAFALDGLYPCGPVFEKLTKYSYGAIIVTKDKKKDPYRFAESIWEHRDQPDEVSTDLETGEKVEFWWLKDVDALKSFGGSVDMLKARVTRKTGTQDSWVIRFKMPSDASASGSKTAKEKAAVAELVAKAEQLPRVLEFGRPTSGFAGLPVEARLETLYFWDSNFSREDVDGPAAAFFESLGADAVVPELARMHADAMMFLQEELSYWDVQVPQATLAGFGSYDDLLAHVSDDAAEELGNGWANFEPRVEVIKDGNEVIGALIHYERDLDGDHEYGSTWVYDHTANKLIGSVEWGYERDTDFQIY